MPEILIKGIDVAEDGLSLTIHWGNVHKRRCSSKWLRFNCMCDKCKPEFSGMYPLDRADFEDNNIIESAIVSDEELHCKITKDVYLNHVTKISLGYLLSNCNCDACIKNDLSKRRVVMPLPSTDSVPYADYDSTLTEEGLFSFLEKFMKYGYCVVRNFPISKENGLEFGKTFSHIRSTPYGETFDVRSVVKPCNIAYTSVALPCHQDLMWYESAPGVQVLHALRFDKEVIGGESKIVDLFGCVEILRKTEPGHFETLCRVPGGNDTIDMNRKVPLWFKNTKKHIELDYFDEIVAVNWHPSFETTLQIKECDVDAYYRAHKAFMKIVHNAENQFIFRMQKGDMLVMNNRRMAHAREAFTSVEDGDRNLHGYYLDMDDLKSKYMVLASKLGKVVESLKIGNRSTF
uniref:probable gamma-butyrobetaine dioxygenase n=1 Tax=Styela clava TaxID=7725 RepID=UPI00193A66E9|nr:probable gamma-butyrobetaine dioxygenase [Styela clava]